MRCMRGSSSQRGHLTRCSSSTRQMERLWQLSPLSGDSDDIFLDSETGCIYVSAGEGLVDVIKQVNPDTHSVLTHAATSPGARTSLFEPVSKRLFVADPGSNHEGYIWVYSTR